MDSTFSEQHALWQRLLAHPFQSDDTLDFTARLMRDQAWTRDFALRAIDEYRRFCFLCVLSDDPITPSEAVDEVWHLHLLYTWDYWKVYCPTVLRRPLHHGPTRGGRAEQARFHEQYANTLALYERHFGSPPTDLWPDARKRFASAARWRRVDTRRTFVIARPSRRAIVTSTLVAAGFVLAAGAQAESINPLNWTAGPFLTLYGWLSVLALIVGFTLRHKMRDQGAADTHHLSTPELAYLVAGADRCTDAVVAQMLVDKKLEFDVTSSSLKGTHSTVEQEPERSIVRCVASDGKPDALLRRMAPRLTNIEQRLTQRRLLLDASADWRARALPVLPIVAVVLFGIAKMVIGTARDKPIGFLVIISIVLGVIALVMLFKRPRQTLEGSAAVAKAKLANARLVGAPRAHELALAVAIAGTAVMSTTAFADYHKARHPPGSSGDGGGSDGDGGGGGGCGGCGGGD